MISTTHARAIALAVLGYAGFAVADAANKALTAHYSFFQIMAVDGAVASALLLACAPALGGGRDLFARPALWAHLARAGLYILIGVMVLYAFARLPLATFYTAVFTTPMVVALLALAVYGERPCPRRWAAILGGFAGVLLAFGPGLAAVPEPAVLVALAATVPIAAMQLLARQLPRASALSVGLWPLAGGALAGGALSAPGFVWPTGEHWAVFGIAGAALAVGVTGLGLAYRAAPTALVAPFNYTQIVWGVALGWAVFGDVPGAWTLAGAGVIIAAGLYLLQAEARAPASQTQSPRDLPAQPPPTVRRLTAERTHRRPPPDGPA
jgi:drug/metabolite transporter (DMT)-like permease